MKIVPLFFQYSGGAFVEFYQEKDENRLHSVVNWIVDIAVVIAFACYLVYGFGGRIEVNGGSMKPALDSGDVVLVNRLAYALGSPRRFDIAVFSQGDQAFNMKRIIGLPGETVQIRENRVLYQRRASGSGGGAGRGLHRRAGGISHGAFRG